MRVRIIILLLAVVGAVGCGGDGADAENDGLAGSASGASGDATDAEGGLAGKNAVSGSGGASAGHGGAMSPSGGEGGSIQTGGSTGISGTNRGGGSGATGSAGSSATADAGGSDGSVAGTIWYDGESVGLAFSAGAASLSAGSSASETSNDPHGGKSCMSVSLDAAAGWGHLGWTPSLNHKENDLAAHSRLEFWIRGTSSATAVQLEMHGPGVGCPWVNVKDYLSGGVTTTWQKVSIPLSAFKMDQKRIQVVDFWLTAGTAAFFIDDGRWN